MKRYVLGLAFTENGSVVMVQKNRPEWQAGKLNFIGGKIEPYDETAVHTMSREFEEETGVATHTDEWKCIGSMGSLGHLGTAGGEGSFEVVLFRAGPHDKFLKCQTVEDEEIVIVPKSKFTVDRSLDQWYISNIRTIYEFAVSTDCEDGAFIEIGYQ